MKCGKNLSLISQVCEKKGKEERKEKGRVCTLVNFLLLFKGKHNIALTEE